MSLQRDPQRRELKHLRELGGFSGKRVLELGTGEGRVTWQYAAETRGLTGLDIDRDALRVARVDAPQGVGGRVNLIQASAEHIPLRADSFDLALFSWSF